jgi:hypothetical protein
MKSGAWARRSDFFTPSEPAGGAGSEAADWFAAETVRKVQGLAAGWRRSRGRTGGGEAGPVRRSLTARRAAQPREGAE